MQFESFEEVTSVFIPNYDSKYLSHSVLPVFYEIL